MIDGLRGALVAAALLGLLGPADAGPVAAQDGGALELRLRGSHALPPAGAQGDGTSYLGAGLLAWTPWDGSGGQLWAALDGAASVGGTGGSWLSLSTGAERDWRLSSALAAGLGVGARAFTVGGTAPYRAAAAEAVPRVTWSPAGLELFLEGLAGLGRSEVEVLVSGTGPGGPGGGGGSTETVEQASDLWRVGGGAGLRTTLRDLQLEARIGGWESSSGTFRRVGTAVEGGGRISWRATLALWDTPGGAEAAGGLTVRVPLGGGWRGVATGGRAGPDPLLGSRPGVHAGVSARRALTRFGGAEPALYRVVDEEGARPSVRFVLEAPRAERVELTGDFTDWEPVAMRATDGRWVVEVPVRPGVHHFGFRVDGQWHVPENAPGRVDDQWGRVNATLVVPG